MIKFTRNRSVHLSSFRQAMNSVKPGVNKMKNCNRKAFLYCEYLVVSHHTPHYSASTTIIKNKTQKIFIFWVNLFKLLDIIG